MAHEPVRTYRGGPIRLFSEKPFLGGTPYQGGAFKGYVGLYVCACCHFEVHRVLFGHGDWICRGCVSAWKRANTAERVG
jgi:hypothetical protein